MVKNVEQILSRGERLDLLIDKTDDLSHQARAFRKRSAAVRRQYWWKNVRLMALSVRLALFQLVTCTSLFRPQCTGLCDLDAVLPAHGEPVRRQVEPLFWQLAGFGAVQLYINSVLQGSCKHTKVSICTANY